MDTDFARAPLARAVRVVTVDVVLRGMRWVFAPTTVSGRHHVDQLDGPVVVASNHASHADTMVILTTLPRRLRRRMAMAAAADYFFANRVFGSVTAVAMGGFPVDRDRVNRRTLDLCQRLLGEGWSLTIYPEGGRSTDGVIREFKPGAAWIARRAGVPVVPVRLEGTEGVMRKGARLPRRSPVRISYGAPLVCGEDEDAKEFGRRVEAAVRAMGTPDLRRSDRG